MPTYSRANTDLLQAATQNKTEFLNRLFGGCAPAASGAAGTDLSVVPEGSNIVGVGYEAKSTEGAMVEGEIAVRIYVRSKLSLTEAPVDERVPADINGTPTYVIAGGDVTALVRPTKSV